MTSELLSSESRHIGLEEALRLSAAFSARSSDGEVPATMQVPVPRGVLGEFDARPWGWIEEADREAFRHFYQRVGEALEEVAASIRAGAEISEAAWSEIARTVRDGR